MHHLRRLLLFHIPLFAAVVCIAFILLQAGVGKPSIVSKVNIDDQYAVESGINDSLNNFWQKRHGIDLPVFYFSITSYSQKGGPGYWIPAIRYHADNKFHEWIFGNNDSRGIFRGDFGMSLRTQLRVSDIIRNGLSNTLSFSLVALLLACLISIPSGLWAASRSGTIAEKTVDRINLLLMVMPLFWISTLLAMILTDPYLLGWLPVPGSWPSEMNGERVGLSQWILPSVCYSIAPAAFFHRWIKETAHAELRKDYVQTALAKGVDNRRILHTHVFKNLLPGIITLLGQLIPLILSGSILIETVFSIPGMGWYLHQAVDAKDLPVICGIFFFYALLASVCYAATDLLGGMVDNRRTKQFSAT